MQQPAMGCVSQNLAKGRLQGCKKTQRIEERTGTRSDTERRAECPLPAARYHDLETLCAGIPSNPGSPLLATLPDGCAFPQITAHSLARSRGRFSFKPAGRIAIAADPEEEPVDCIRASDARFVEHFNCVLQLVADRSRGFAVRFPWVD
jgi:hypothetical protein